MRDTLRRFSRWCTLLAILLPTVCSGVPRLAQEPEPPGPYTEFAERLTKVESPTDAELEEWQARVDELANELAAAGERYYAAELHFAWGYFLLKKFNRPESAAEQLGVSAKRFGDAGRKMRFGSVLHWKGKAHLASGNLELALTEYVSAALAFEGIGDRDRLARTLQSKGYVLSRLNRSGSAAESTKEASRLFLELGETRLAIDNKLNEAGYLYLAGDLDAAEQRLERAAGLLTDAGDKVRDDPALAERVAIVRGSILHDRGALGEARAVYVDWIARARAKGVAVGSQLLLNFGNLEMAAGNVRDALRYYEESDAAARNARDEGFAQLAMAKAYRELGRTADAVRSLVWAKELAKKAADVRLSMSVLHVLAIQLLEGGHFDNARACLEGLIEEFERGVQPSMAQWVSVWSTYAILLDETGASEEGLAKIREVRERVPADGYFGQALAVQEVSILLNLGRWEEADAGLEELGEATLVAPELRVAAEQYRGKSDLEQERPQAAVRHFREVARLLEAQLVRTIMGLGERTANAFRKKYGTLSGNVVAALRVLDADDDEHQRLAYETLSLHHGLGTAQRLAEPRARLRAALPPELREESDVLARRLGNALAARTRLLGLPVTRDVRERNRRKEELADIDETIGELERELTSFFERARLTGTRLDVRFPRPVLASDVQALLDERRALVELFEGDGRLVAFVVTRDGIDVAMFGERAAIRSEVAALQEALERWKDGAPPLSASDLEPLSARWRKHVTPLLDERELDELWISPSATVQAIPFEILLHEALAEGDQAVEERAAWPFLIRDFDVAYVHSGTVLREIAHSAPRSRPAADAPVFVAFADPVYANEGAHPVRDPVRGESLVRLPGTATEARQVAEIVAAAFPRELREVVEADARLAGEEPFPGVHLLTRADATEDQLKSNRLVRESWILHVGCHGVGDTENAVNSYLALAQDEDAEEDGFLFLHELDALEVRASLLVLAACQSSSGPTEYSEGVASLARAGLTAGARSVLASLWRVRDESSISLVAAFYEAWGPGSVPRIAALSAAKRAAARSGVDPRIWAAYVLWDAPERPR
ncbi:MAG: CHAT domain-containing protein [bacterium]|nr:CHAT domain-containing protein [bacterium]